MYEKLTKKDIIACNQAFEERSNIVNEASLDFAIGYTKRTYNWHKALAYLVRAVLIDHVFEDGNKRTAALLVETYARFEGYDIDREQLANMIKIMLLKNITSIRKIEEMIHDVIK